MRIQELLTLTTTEQQQIEDFGHFISKICDTVGRTECKKSDCIFEEFCSYTGDLSYNFLTLLEKEFKCEVNMDFEED